MAFLSGFTQRPVHTVALAWMKAQFTALRTQFLNTLRNDTSVTQVAWRRDT